MEFELLERRQSVLAWRDRLVLGVWQVFNCAGIEARRALECRLSDAGFINTVMDPGEFTHDKIDNVMRMTVRNQLEPMFARAAENLREIDPRYAELAQALVGGLSLLQYPLPVVQHAANNASGSKSAVADPPRGRLNALMEAVARQELARNAREWGSWALELVSDASEVARQKIQSGSGMHDRLRKSAQMRIDTAWMASAGDPMPMMGQLIAVIESVGNEARSMAL